MISLRFNWSVWMLAYLGLVASCSGEGPSESPRAAAVIEVGVEGAVTLPDSADGVAMVRAAGDGRLHVVSMDEDAMVLAKWVDDPFQVTGVPVPAEVAVVEGGAVAVRFEDDGARIELHDLVTGTARWSRPIGPHLGFPFECGDGAACLLGHPEGDAAFYRADGQGVVAGFGASTVPLFGDERVVVGVVERDDPEPNQLVVYSTSGDLLWSWTDSAVALEPSTGWSVDRTSHDGLSVVVGDDHLLFSSGGELLSRGSVAGCVPSLHRMEVVCRETSDGHIDVLDAKSEQVLVSGVDPDSEERYALDGTPLVVVDGEQRLWTDPTGAVESTLGWCPVEAEPRVELGRLSQRIPQHLFPCLLDERIPVEADDVLAVIAEVAEADPVEVNHLARRIGDTWWWFDAADRLVRVNVP